MSDLYDQQIATHYSAYRPPLHQMILKRALSKNNQFSTGLDIGCGTGYSTIALADYCSDVIGIDPSQSMLDRASKQKNINYLTGSGEDIPLPESSVDIVTFAGSLFYMNVDTVAEELERVGKQDVLIIPYDFEVVLDDILSQFEIKKEERNSDYNYKVNFSEIDSFEELTSEQERIQLNLSPAELAHVLLSDQFLFKAFSKKFTSDHPFVQLKREMHPVGNTIPIQANIFYSMYRIP